MESTLKTSFTSSPAKPPLLEQSVNKLSLSTDHKPSFKINLNFHTSLKHSPLPKGMSAFFKVNLDKKPANLMDFIKSEAFLESCNPFNRSSSNSFLKNASASTSSSKDYLAKKKKSCPCRSNAFTVLSWDNSRIVFFPEIVCLLTR